jgi:hypothetical protein
MSGFSLPPCDTFSFNPFPLQNGTLQLPFRDNPLSQVIEENSSQRSVLRDISNALPSRILTLACLLTRSLAEPAQGKVLQGLRATKANTRLLS